MRRHHYATDTSANIHVFHSPASRNAWVFGRRSVQARILTAGQARDAIGSKTFLLIREADHDPHFSVPPHQPDPTPNTYGKTLNALGHPYDGDTSPRMPHNVLTWDHGLLELAIFIKSPTPRETWAFRQDRARATMLSEPPVIWLLLDIPGVYTAEAPFTPHLTHPDARLIPDLPTPDTRYPITVIMADASNGLVKAIRYATLSTAITARLQQAARTLLATPFDRNAYNAAVQDTQARYPTPVHLMLTAPPPEPLGS